MTASVNPDEVRALAQCMTTKLNLVGLPIGGAKAGIVAAPDQRDTVLRSFGHTVSPLLRGGIYLGTDQGTTHADRECYFAAAGYDIRRQPGTTRLTTDWTSLWRRTRLAGISGYGVTQSVLTALRMRGSTKPHRVTIQGFGTVGRSVATTLQAHGHSIVAVADVLGTVADPAGLPVEALRAITDAEGTIDRFALPPRVTILTSPEAWLDVDAEILVLAAGGSAVREDNAGRVRAAVVVEGGNLSCTDHAADALLSAGVLVIPGVVANVGSAAATGCVLTGVAPSDLPTEQLVAWMFDWVGGRIRENTRAFVELSVGGGDPLEGLIAARQPGGGASSASARGW